MPPLLGRSMHKCTPPYVYPPYTQCYAEPRYRLGTEP